MFDTFRRIFEQIDERILFFEKINFQKKKIDLKEQKNPSCIIFYKSLIPSTDFSYPKKRQNSVNYAKEHHTFWIFSASK